MKLAISNIAWPAEMDDTILPLLQNQVAAVEIAPTRLWPDWQFDEIAIAAWRQTLQHHGLVCSSLQALVYGRPNLQLFGPPEARAALVTHLKRVAKLAAKLGAKPMVFGAPKQRDRGNLSEAAAFAAAVEVFAEVGDYCDQQGVCLCIEPNPPQYGCNFVTNSQQGAELVRSVNSPGFRLHLDAAGMHLAGEETARALESTADVLEHIHVSEPNLSDFAAPQVNHAQVAAGLKAIGWNKWVSIEMAASTDPIASVKQAIETVTQQYVGV